MADTTRVRVKHRTATKQKWETELSAEILLNGEIAFVRDVDASANYFKVGDGTSKFCNLPYVTSPGSADADIVAKTRQEWQNDPGFVPHKGQVVIWTDRSTLSSGVVVPGIKIGDSNAYNIDLPFVGDDVAEQAMAALAAHVSNTDVHLQEKERDKWNHKISVGDIEDPSDDGVRGENLIITRN